MSSFVFKIAASPSRTTRWSSEMSTLIFSMGDRLLVDQGDIDDDCRATSFFRFDFGFAAHESGSFQNSSNSEMVPFVGITQHCVHIESYAIVPDGNPETFGLDVQPYGDPSRFRVSLHVAEGFLNNTEEENLGPRE